MGLYCIVVFLDCAALHPGYVHLSKPGDVINEVASALQRWPEFAQKAGVNKKIANNIADHHKLKILD